MNNRDRKKVGSRLALSCATFSLITKAYGRAPSSCPIFIPDSINYNCEQRQTYPTQIWALKISKSHVLSSIYEADILVKWVTSLLQLAQKLLATIITVINMLVTTLDFFTNCDGGQGVPNRITGYATGDGVPMTMDVSMQS